MKILFTIFLLATSSAFGSQSCHIDGQDGTMDTWYCRDSAGKFRCYADVTYSDGTKARILGGGNGSGHHGQMGHCYSGFADCWWSGPGAVHPDCAF